MQDQSSLDLKLFRVWMKASKAVAKNINKDINSHKGPHPVSLIS